MKQRIIFIFLIFLSGLGYSQELDCKRFKNGKFKIIDPEVGNSIIERNGNKQIEYDEKTGQKIEFKVKWIDDCTYRLKVKEVLENPDNSFIPTNMILTVEIIETKENSYVQKSKSDWFDVVLESEIFIVD